VSPRKECLQERCVSKNGVSSRRVLLLVCLQERCVSEIGAAACAMLAAAAAAASCAKANIAHAEANRRALRKGIKLEKCTGSYRKVTSVCCFLCAVSYCQRTAWKLQLPWRLPRLLCFGYLPKGARKVPVTSWCTPFLLCRENKTSRYLSIHAACHFCFAETKKIDLVIFYIYMQRELNL
jgi:hypothetical protein